MADRAPQGQQPGALRARRGVDRQQGDTVRISANSVCMHAMGEHHYLPFHAVFCSDP